MLSVVKSCHGDRSEKLSDADARLYIKVLYTDYTGGEGSLIADLALTVLGDSQPLATSAQHMLYSTFPYTCLCTPTSVLLLPFCTI